jgi:hypothetical protein
MLRHHAALVSGKLTRVPSGVNFPPSEVIMSRCARGGTRRARVEARRRGAVLVARCSPRVLGAELWTRNSCYHYWALSLAF